MGGAKEEEETSFLLGWFSAADNDSIHKKKEREDGAFMLDVVDIKIFLLLFLRLFHVEKERKKDFWT